MAKAFRMPVFQMRMSRLSELRKIDLAVLFVGGAAMVIGSLLLLEIALYDLSGVYGP